MCILYIKSSDISFLLFASRRILRLIILDISLLKYQKINNTNYTRLIVRTNLPMILRAILFAHFLYLLSN